MLPNLYPRLRPDLVVNKFLCTLTMTDWKMKFKIKLKTLRLLISTLYFENVVNMCVCLNVCAVRVSERVLSENKSARDYSLSAIQRRTFDVTVLLSWKKLKFIMPGKFHLNISIFKIILKVYLTIAFFGFRNLPWMPTWLLRRILQMFLQLSQMQEMNLIPNSITSWIFFLFWCFFKVQINLC